MSELNKAFFQVADIHTYYGDSYILQGIDLIAAQARTFAILGRNGVGKSTLANTIMGFIRPRAGSITLAGKAVTTSTPEARSRAGIALVPQGRRTFGSLSVQETLDLASHLKKYDNNNLSWSLDEIYDAFPRLAERKYNRAGTLSGGEQQMLAVSRALVGNPQLLVLDEPTEGLSPLLVQELQNVLRQVKERGTTLLLIEQRIAFALALADEVAIINKGMVVHNASPQELKDTPEIMQRYLGV